VDLLKYDVLRHGEAKFSVGCGHLFNGNSTINEFSILTSFIFFLDKKNEPKKIKTYSNFTKHYVCCGAKIKASVDFNPLGPQLTLDNNE
jgi:hypothetical protein